MMIIILYYITIVSLALTSFTLSVRENDLYFAELFSYFACESKGNGSCPTSGYEAYMYPEINTIAYFLAGFFPAINLIYALNLKEIKSVCLGVKKKIEVMSKPTVVSSLQSHESN